MITLTVVKVGGWKKITGLIGKRKPEAILLKTRFGIHTFGLRFPIDILVLDSQNGVVVMKHNLKPNRFFIWPPKFSKVIELPLGTIKEKKIKIGTEIKLVF